MAWNHEASCGSGFSADVLYILNLHCLTAVQASLCGSSYNTTLTVCTGGSCPGDSALTCNNDYCGNQSQVNSDGQPYQNYYLLVGGNCQLINHFYVCDYGAYTLHVTTPTVPKDSCSGAATANVTPSAANRIDSTNGTTYIDANVVNTAATTYFYAVSALTASASSPLIAELALPPLDEATRQLLGAKAASRPR